MIVGGRLPGSIRRGSGRRGKEALEVGAFGEAHGVIDGVAGAVDLVQGAACLLRRPVHRREKAPALTRLEHEAITSVPPGASTPSASR